MEQGRGLNFSEPTMLSVANATTCDSLGRKSQERRRHPNRTPPVANATTFDSLTDQTKTHAVAFATSKQHRPLDLGLASQATTYRRLRDCRTPQPTGSGTYHISSTARFTWSARPHGPNAPNGSKLQSKPAPAPGTPEPQPNLPPLATQQFRVSQNTEQGRAVYNRWPTPLLHIH